MSAQEPSRKSSVSTFNHSIRKPQPTADNAAKNRKARKKLTELELQCGITHEQYQQIHGDMRARVLARYGKAA